MNVYFESVIIFIVFYHQYEINDIIFCICTDGLIWGLSH